MHRDRPLVGAIRERRRLQAGITHAGYAIAGATLGVAVTRIDVGPEVDRGQAFGLLAGMAGGLITFIALIFSLLFLVVQYGSSSLSPRLTLFRDAPFLRHAFGFFVGVFVFCVTAALTIQRGDEVSAIIPLAATGLVVVALGVSNSLQLRAFRSIEFSHTLTDIAARGHSVLNAMYPEPAPERAGHEPPISSAVTGELRWPGQVAVLQEIDVPGLLSAATRADTIIDVRARVGHALQPRQLVLVTRGGGALDEHAALDLVDTGSQRTFDQDPLFALRLLVDIADRALSAAINDPATAVQAIDHIEGLLTVAAQRDLDVGRVFDSGGHLRVVVSPPTWDEYLEVGYDEVAFYGKDAPSVERRLALMLDDLLAVAPDHRKPAIEARRAKPPPSDSPT